MIALGFRGEAAAEEPPDDHEARAARRAVEAARVVEHIENGVQQAVTAGPAEARRPDAA